MQPVSFDRISYLSEGKRIFLISGEVHYFRVPREGWRDRLEKMKAAGGNCIATYVPWLIHEPREGAFDFDDPQFDVEAFLETCNEVGIWAVVRPGPYQYSELIYAGLPGWLCEGYPELLGRRLDGEAISSYSISYLHPTFLAKARRWYDEVVPRLARHQVSQGGAVAAMQIDNEMMGIHEWFSGGWDYNRETMGIGKEEGRWPEFLQARYGSLEAVSEAHGIQAATWAEALPIDRLVSGTVEERRRMKDYQDCYFASIGEYAATLISWMRGHGVDVPIVHNSASPYMNSYFRETVARLGDDFLLGSDHYYNLNMDWDQNNPTPKYGVNCFYSNEMLRHYGVPPTIFELPGGSLSDYPPITPHDAGCSYLTNIAYGMKGYNYYIFAGGFNPPGVGTTSEVYDYGAAVSPTGELRDLYSVQRDLAGFLTEHAWLAQAGRVADCQIGLTWEYSRSKNYGANGPEGTFPNYEAWKFFRKGLVMTSFCAGLSPNLADITSDALLEQTDLPLMLGTGSALSRDIQERLVKFLEAGGSLFLAPLAPTLDEAFQPCTILADYLGGVKQEQFPANAPVLDAYGVPNVYVNGGLFRAMQRPQGETTAIERVSGEEIGWQMRLPSGGMVSVLGLHWIEAKREHEAMLRGALAPLGLRPVVRCDNPNIWTSLRSNGQRSMLFILNLLTAPMTATISYRDPASGQWVDTGTHTLPGISAQAWHEGQVVYRTAYPRH